MGSGACSFLDDEGLLFLAFEAGLDDLEAGAAWISKYEYERWSETTVTAYEPCVSVRWFLRQAPHPRRQSDRLRRQSLHRTLRSI